jgi:hypothetical protein
MKAGQYDGVVTTVEVRSGFTDEVFPAGTEGAVVECYENPREAYRVDLVVADERSATGRRYDNVLLFPDQFDVVSKAKVDKDYRAKS